MLAASKAVN